MEATLEELAALTGATLRGDPSTRIVGVAGIQHARPGELALMAGPRYKPFLDKTGASALVVGPDFDPGSTPLPLLVAARPEEAFEAIASRLCPASPAPEPGIDPTARVAADALIGSGAAIQACCVVEPGAVVGARTVLRPFAFVGRDARIGSDCLLHPHAAVLDRCVVGDRAILHSGVVVGADGYGFETRDGVHHKLPQRGVVEIGDDVEIGANTTIDRARYGRTVIGSGTKIDNLVMVAHNCVTGEHCLLVAQAGLAGSTTLGHHVVVAAQAGLVGHMTVGDGAIIGAQAGVPGDVATGEVVLGSPAQPIQKERRCMVAYKKLPELVERIRQLEGTVQRLTEKINSLEATAEDNQESR